MTTAQLIVRARKRKKLSATELANALGVSRSTVHAWEHEGPGPKIKHLHAIAEKLGVDVGDLIGEAPKS